MASSNCKSMPLLVHLEVDGGGDHNIRHLLNVMAIVAIFLVGEMDKLQVTRGCPNLSYLNTTERAMPVHTLGASGISLVIGFQAREWLIPEVIGYAKSMKSVRDCIDQYDEELPQAIEFLKRLLKQEEN